MRLVCLRARKLTFSHKQDIKDFKGFKHTIKHDFREVPLVVCNIFESPKCIKNNLAYHIEVLLYMFILDTAEIFAKMYV